MKKAIFVFLPLVFSLSVLTSQEIFTSGNFLYKVIGQSITITEYTGNNAIVQTPASIGDLPVTAIGDRAFYGCKSLRIVTIPSSVTTIGDWAFSGCTGLMRINVETRNIAYMSLAGVLFDKSGKTLMFYPAGNTGAYTVPSSVTTIVNSAFFNCASLTSVNIPSSVTTIGGRTFFGCKSLTSINVEERNNVYMSIVGVLFDKDGKTLVCYPSGKSGTYTIPSSVITIEDGAFFGCKGLTSVSIPSLVTAIGNWAFFGCTGLKNVSISSSVTTIGDWAFFDCTSLTSVTIPSSVIAIGNNAFSGCTNLTNVTIPSSVIVIKDEAFYYCNLTSVTLSRRTIVGKNAFDNGVLIHYRD